MPERHIFKFRRIGQNRAGGGIEGNQGQQAAGNRPQLERTGAKGDRGTEIVLRSAFGIGTRILEPGTRFSKL